MSGMEAMTKRVAESFERMSLPILLVSLLLTGFLAYFLVGSLAFTTDLSSFAPDTDADDAQERIEGAIGTSPHRSIGTVFLAPLFVFLAQWAYGQGVIKAWREIRRTGGRAGEGSQIDDRVRTA